MTRIDWYTPIKEHQKHSWCFWPDTISTSEVDRDELLNRVHAITLELDEMVMNGDITTSRAAEIMGLPLETYRRLADVIHRNNSK